MFWRSEVGQGQRLDVLAGANFYIYAIFGKQDNIMVWSWCQINHTKLLNLKLHVPFLTSQQSFLKKMTYLVHNWKQIIEIVGGKCSQVLSHHPRSITRDNKDNMLFAPQTKLQPRDCQSEDQERGARGRCWTSPQVTYQWEIWKVPPSSPSSCV